MAALLVACAALAPYAAAATSPSAAPPHSAHAVFTVTPDPPRAGEPAQLGFRVVDANGATVRFLQFVHERPLHLIVVSSDLAEFAHVHPEPGVDDVYRVTHTFEYGGRYRLFADFAPPGAGPTVEHFDVDVAGAPRANAPLVPDSASTAVVEGVRVTLSTDRPPRARDDLLLKIAFADVATGAPVTDLQLFLGALAHVILVSQDLADFVHAHPLETGEVYDPSRDPATVHVHDPAQLAKVLVGPSPPEIRAATSLPHAGLYKVWVQFRRHDRELTAPFVLHVAASPASRAASAKPVPTSPPLQAIRVAVGSSGYAPARIDLRRGEPAVLAFSRPDAGNCGGTVVIPALGIRRDLPVGETVVLRFTPDRTGEIPFTCGMGMYEGLIVVH